LLTGSEMSGVAEIYGIIAADAAAELAFGLGLASVLSLPAMVSSRLR
jgi:hypothetical protein